MLQGVSLFLFNELYVFEKKGGEDEHKQRES